MSLGTSPSRFETAPRYTSYPTTPHFGRAIDDKVVRQWFSDMPAGDAASLYLHIPFCDRLCWFCACHTQHTVRYKPVARYLDLLRSEIGLVSALTKHVRIGKIHFGGGSPNILKNSDIQALMRLLHASFEVDDNVALSVEIDPTDMTEAKLDGLLAAGLGRASIGIQDFDPRVQEAVNRPQTFDITSHVIEHLRKGGVRSVNVDLLYGLPHQTERSLAATVTQVLSIKPDRIALFGYAHVPWFKKHQRLIDEQALPRPIARFQQARMAGQMLVDAGYRQIGIDHFALPGDGLAVAAESGRLRRNFQGYTDDPCSTLIGLGTSSVSEFQSGYAQNVTAIGDYERALSAGRLPTAKGIRLTTDNRARRWLIERLMCDFAFSTNELVERFGPVGRTLVSEARFIASEPDSDLSDDGDLFRLPEEARPFVRSIAARFDPYFRTGNARHSLAV